MAQLPTFRSIAKEMDTEYERLAAARVKSAKEKGERSRQTCQLDGRLDMLAWWASRLRNAAQERDSND